MEKKVTAIKSTEAGRRAYQFTKKMYSRALEAKEAGRPVAWSMASSSGLTETILYAMDVAAVFPENYATVCCVKQAHIPLIEYTEADGFSNVTCGYFRVSSGFARKMADTGEIPPGSPVGGMAKPDLLVGVSSPCEPHAKWFQAMQRYLNVPYHCVDLPTPPVVHGLEQVPRDCLDYTAEELRVFVAFLEKHLGRKMDMDRLCEAVATFEETRRLLYKCNEIRKAIPCPMGSEDAFACIVPGFWMPAERESVDFYRDLYTELKYRVENKIGVVPDEKYRLLGPSAPAWHDNRVFNFLAEHGAVGCIEGYVYYFVPPPIPEGTTDPFMRLAWWFLWWWTKGIIATEETESMRTQRLLEWARDYKLDGAFLHSPLGCRFVSYGNVHTKNVLMRYVKVPTYILVSDLVDSRVHPEAELRRDLETFLETMDHYKRLRQAEGIA